ncbi:hypothetical protein GQ55_2G419900 [Panicum hallii var. hallii]|uniref:BED-type domain-containing protein n=1 Tax=Panicum hallii var. hallii TaxID=1504633 RepID=A0A2T7EY52_9POAL|nr:hypothetical protein GQ55_2G419900 [Panicum hallii var. hallii]PUZ72755.1 hypothetical protein GQ55_2G419900 [Panicum hallii var. hallii]
MPQLLMTTPEIVPCSHLRQIGGHQFGPSPNRRSPVWKYYELELINEDGVLKAVCKYCGSKMTTRRKTEIVEYKIVLKRYATSQQQPFPTEDEWSKAESIGKFFGVFEETTKAFSADRFSRAYLFLVNVLFIHQALRSHAWQHQVIK